MDAVLIAILAATSLLVLAGMLFFALLSGHRRDMRQDLLAVHQTADRRLAALDQRLDAIQTGIGQSMSNTTETIGRINQQLGALGKSAERILEVGQDVAALQDILQPPKLRGGLGELLLERLLEQVVPGAYRLQHRFRGGDVVDAVIEFRGMLVPIDSKFPLESYQRLSAAATDDERRQQRRAFQRAVRGHIEAVARYIRPDEATLDFALMYVPAESVYYEMATAPDSDFFAFALERRVFPVSPATMYVYLASIGMGLRGLRVENTAREIIATLGRLSQDFDAFLREFRILGSHLDSARKKYDLVSVQAERFSEKLIVPLAGADAVEDPQPRLMAVDQASGE